MTEERDVRIMVVITTEHDCNPLVGEYQWALCEIVAGLLWSCEIDLIGNEVDEWIDANFDKLPEEGTAILHMKLETEIESYPHYQMYFTTTGYDVVES